jgi:hypothetical protein
MKKRGSLLDHTRHTSGGVGGMEVFLLLAAIGRNTPKSITNTGKYMQN